MKNILDAITEFIKKLPNIYEKLSFLDEPYRFLVSCFISTVIALIAIIGASMIIKGTWSIINRDGPSTSKPKEPYKEKKKGKYER